MKKPLLTFPLLWVLLTAMWLLLYLSLHPAHWLLGAVVAFVAMSLYALLQPPIRLLHRFGAIAELLVIWALDIVRSNIDVARIVVRERSYHHTSAFLDIPLRTRSTPALVVLALIITSNPGTVWGRYDAEGNVLTLHILDLRDENEWLSIIQDRYERRLLEIFG